MIRRSTINKRSADITQCEMSLDVSVSPNFRKNNNKKNIDQTSNPIMCLYILISVL